MKTLCLMVSQFSIPYLYCTRLASSRLLIRTILSNCVRLVSPVHLLNNIYIFKVSTGHCILAMGWDGWETSRSYKHFEWGGNFNSWISGNFDCYFSLPISFCEKNGCLMFAYHICIVILTFWLLTIHSLFLKWSL